MGFTVAVCVAGILGYVLGRFSKPENSTLIEGASLVGSAGDFIRNSGHESFAQSLYRLSHDLRKAAS